MRHSGRRLRAALVSLALVVGAAVAVPATSSAAAPSPKDAVAVVKAEGRPRALVPADGKDCLPGSERVGPALFNDFVTEFILPNAPFGWDLIAKQDGSGDSYRRSSLTWTGSLNFARMPVAEGVFRPAATTYLSITYRGSFVHKGAYAVVNNWAYSPVPQADPTVWTTTRFDITGTLSEDPDNTFSLTFLNDPARVSSTATSTIELDRYEVYQCTPVPSKARGDFDGDGIMDIVFLDGSDQLFMYPNYGTDGKIGNLVLMDRRFGPATWLGSPGDLTGDGHADLLTRRKDGTLWCYPGDGVRGFSTPTLVGSYWQKMWAIVPTGDMDGDGNRDMLGLEAPGNLYRYTLVTGPQPKIINKTLIGVQFYEFRNLISSGDYSGDGTPDILGVKYDDTMWGYYTAPGSGRLSSHGKFLGSGWKMKTVSSPGDFNGNGFDDVLALGPTNDLVVYYVKDGHWDGSVLVKSGFFPKLLA